MKFRCERDVLVEALGDRRPRRRQPGRRAARPVRRASRARRRSAAPHRQRPRADDRRRDRRWPGRPTAWPSCRRDSPPISCASLQSRQRRGRTSTTTRPTSRRDGSSSAIRLLPADEFPRLSSPSRRRGHPGRRRVRRRAAPGGAGGQRATTPARSSPACSWPRRPTGCAWWPPTPTAWPCATCPARAVLREGQTSSCRRRALRELAAAARRRGRGRRCASASMTPRFEVGDVRLTTRLIEGEFPNYRRPHPREPPNRLTVGRESLLEAVRRVKLMAREATPVRLAMSGDGLELVAITQDVGQAHEELDAKLRGHRAHRGVQPRVPPQRHRGRPRATRSPSIRSTP